MEVTLKTRDDITLPWMLLLAENVLGVMLRFSTSDRKRGGKIHPTNLPETFVSMAEATARLINNKDAHKHFQDTFPGHFNILAELMSQCLEMEEMT